MTKTTKTFFVISLLFLIAAVIVGWQGDKREEFGTLLAFYPGLGFVAAFSIAFLRVLYIENPENNFFSKSHKKLDSYITYSLLAITLLLFIWISIKGN